MYRLAVICSVFHAIVGTIEHVHVHISTCTCNVYMFTIRKTLFLTNISIFHYKLCQIREELLQNPHIGLLHPRLADIKFQIVLCSILSTMSNGLLLHSKRQTPL